MKRIFVLMIAFCFVIPVFAQKFEAEAGNLSGAKMETEVTGFSGTGYVKFGAFMNGCADLTVKIKKDGLYAINLNYAQAKDEGGAVVKIEVDDKYLMTQLLPKTEAKKYETVLVNNTVQLTKGEHSVKVYGSKADFYFDSIEIIPATDQIITQLTPSGLVNKNASEQAKNVYNYLVSMRGKGILSGQQIYGSNTAEIKTIVSVTGKNPAVLGIDLIDFSPSRVAHGATGGRTVSVAKKYWDEGGLVTCAWHWNAPMNLIDKDVPEMRWYDGFRTKATTYDFTIALRDSESEEYKTMIRDIDAIAKQLKILSDAGVPVLWRPLHEASGKWFWWGSKGAENYIKLYKLLYDRLVNFHGLNNLIWVWNGQDAEWYPGDEYVDVISYDYYPMKFKHGTADEYLTKIQAATGEPKLYAISENGALPNVVKLAEEKSLWNWWCTWNGDFVVAADGKSYSESNTTLETLKLYYDNPYTITRDELPNLK